MHRPVVSLLLLALPLVATATPAPRSFFRRSFDPNSVPAQCTSACAPLTAIYNSCINSGVNIVACGGCSTKVEQDSVQCGNCLVSINPAVIEVEQFNIDEVIDECALDGVVLPPVQLTPATAAANANPNPTQAGPMTIANNGGGNDANPNPNSSQAPASNSGGGSGANLNPNPNPSQGSTAPASNGGGSTGASSDSNSSPLSGGNSGSVGGAPGLRVLPSVIMASVIFIQAMCM